MKVAIASKSRPNKVLPLRWLQQPPLVFVEPQDESSYRAAIGGKAEIINIGQDDQGLVFVRQFIAELLRDEIVLMLDDDVDAIYERKGGKLKPVTDSSDFLAYLEKSLVEKNLGQAGISYRPSNWLFTGEWKYFYRAWAIKLINFPQLTEKNVHFETEVGEAGLFEDYALCLAMYRAGIPFATTYRYAFSCAAKMGTNAGGLQKFRNPAKSREEAFRLQKKYGPNLVQVRYNKTHQQYEAVIQWSVMKGGL